MGWRSGDSELTFNNCLQNGTLSLKQENGSATFNRNGGSTLNGCYYRTAYGDVQGTQTSATGSDLKDLLRSGWRVSGDGGGHTTSGLNVMVTSSDWSNSAVAGLFGRVRMGGVVRNVGLVSPAVSCTTNKANRAGAIVGCVDVDGFVTHCFVLNPCSVSASGASNNYAGLFVGQKYDGTFANLYYYGTTSLPMCG